jgi:hypothetical protein
MHEEIPMSDNEQNKPKTKADPQEDRTLPSQAEGAREDSPPYPDLSTPNQAEGEREDVEETLRALEKKRRAP